MSDENNKLENKPTDDVVNTPTAADDVDTNDTPTDNKVVHGVSLEPKDPESLISRVHNDDLARLTDDLEKVVGKKLADRIIAKKEEVLKNARDEE